MVNSLLGCSDQASVKVADLAGEGIGRNPYREKYKQANGNYTGRTTHFLIPGIVNLNASQITFYSIWLRSFRGCAVMVTPYDG